jgi:hypothetical protein
VGLGATFVLGVALLVTGCRRDTPVEDKKDGGPPRAPTITANPNPATWTDGKFGKTTIAWDTGDGSSGDVFMSHEGGDEKAFARDRPKSSQEAAWIGKGVYEFRLYSAKDRKKPLAMVQVTRADKK